MDPLIWLIIAAVAYATFEHFAEQRRIRKLLEDVDREWNSLLIQHQKAIADSYQEGKVFQINMIRR